MSDNRSAESNEQKVALLHDDNHKEKSSSASSSAAIAAPHPPPIYKDDADGKIASSSPPPYTPSIHSTEDSLPLLADRDEEAQLTPQRKPCFIKRLLRQRSPRRNPYRKISPKKTITYLFLSLLLSALIIFVIAVLYFHPITIKQYLTSQKTLHIDDLDINGINEIGQPVSTVKAWIEFEPQENREFVWKRLSSWINDKLVVDDATYEIMVPTDPEIESIAATGIDKLFRPCMVNLLDQEQAGQYTLIAKLHLQKFRPSLEGQNPIVHVVNEGAETEIVNRPYLEALLNKIGNDKENSKDLAIRIVGNPGMRLYGVPLVGVGMNLDVELSLSPATFFRDFGKFQFALTGYKLHFPHRDASAQDAVEERHYTLNINTTFENPYPLHINLPVSAGIPIFYVPKHTPNPCSADLKPIAYVVAPAANMLRLNPGQVDFPAAVNIPVSQLEALVEMMARYQLGKRVTVRVGPGAYLENLSKPDPEVNPLNFCLVQKIRKPSKAQTQASSIFDKLLEQLRQELASLSIPVSQPKPEPELKPQSQPEPSKPVDDSVASPKPSPVSIPLPESISDMINRASHIAKEELSKLGSSIESVEKQIEQGVDELIHDMKHFISSASDHDHSNADDEEFEVIEIEEVEEVEEIVVPAVMNSGVGPAVVEFDIEEKVDANGNIEVDINVNPVPAVERIVEVDIAFEK
ncbi:hypothetical protein BKA69DRAFT_1122558 [Paraphysoderma sedebokerense]|nr:hypothetical protein BKA69DRAFT_1122558 [Paraphysoderma sedebokerense]